MSAAPLSDELTEELIATVPRSEYGTYPSEKGNKGMERPHDDFREKYGYSWDLCMIFSTEVQEGEQTPADIVRRLHNAGLETFCFKSIQRNEIIVKIRAPLKRLERCAESVNYFMLLDEEKLKRAVEEGSKEPPIEGSKIADNHAITDYRPHEYIYGKYIASRLLAPLYACPSYLAHPFSSVHRIKLITWIIETAQVDGCGINISDLVQNNVLKAFFPYHDEERRRELSRLWVTRWSYPTAQPYEQIKDYLGEKIALYFALLGHYTAWLVPLSIVGLITAIDQLAEWKLDATLAPYFSVFVSFWAVVMLEFWKWGESTMAMRWGTSNFEKSEQDRAEFKGEIIVSFVDGKPMKYYPRERYIQLMVWANLLVIVMLAFTIALIAAIFVLEVKWDDSSIWFFSELGSYLTSILLAVEIYIMESVYLGVAVWTTKLENHKTDTAFEDVLIVKLAVFQCVNAYASLYYIAFVQPYVSGCSYSSCLDSLCQSLAIIFCMRLIIANTIEIFLPRYNMREKAKKERAGVPEGILFSESEVQYAYNTYDEMMGPLGDMSETLIQFGYVTLFVVAFPIAPLLAYISNYIEIRIDAVKILYEYRRPFPRGAQDIGTWQIVWTCVAALAVTTNAGLAFFTSDSLDWSDGDLVWGFVVWQYVIFIPMAFFSKFVPNIPLDVVTQLRRQKFITSKVIYQEPDKSQPHQERAMEWASLEIHDHDNEPPPEETIISLFTFI